jgi:O-antigen/teichoic acid export membrane protein
VSNPLKKLAGQTALYGVSTIVGRMLNYLLVPLYTYQFSRPDEFGVITEFYAYIAFLNIVLIYGMETALFNFSVRRDDGRLVYSTALLSLWITTGLFLAVVLWQAGTLADLLGYRLQPQYVVWTAWILALDTIAALPFAALRQQQRAGRFALLKTINILVNVAASVFLIGVCKWAHDSAQQDGLMGWAASIYQPGIGIGYVFVANLIASAATLVMLLPDLWLRLRFDPVLWRQMLAYALPLMLAGLAGMTNETLGRILLKYLSPGDNSLEQLGIYGACYKMSVLMSIFIQAFRYAAEPFFFAYYKQQDSRTLYALVMNWFVIACSVILLAVMMNMSWIQYFVGANYRSGIAVVPILLLANLCLGVFFNFSIWYKLTQKTRFGAWLTFWGAGVTVFLNFLWVPWLGYMGSAWATLVCYASMAWLSGLLGQHYYPIPYYFLRLLVYPLLAVSLVFLAEKTIAGASWQDLLLRNGLLLAFMLGTALFERRGLHKEKHRRSG